MFRLSPAAEKYMHEEGLDSDKELAACCSAITTYGIIIGTSAAAGAIGQSILANPSAVAQISYETAVQAGAIGGTVGAPTQALLNACFCGGNDVRSMSEEGCVAFLNNFLASALKAACFLPDSIAYAITATLKSGGFGALFFLAGAGMKGALISPQAIAQAAAIGGLGNLILGGSVTICFVSYNTIKNGKVDLCTPSIVVAGCDECASPSLPAWRSFRGSPKPQAEMTRADTVPAAVVIEALPVLQQPASAPPISEAADEQRSKLTPV